MKKSLFTIVTIVGLTFAVSGCNPNKSVKREMSEQQKIFYHKIIDINSMERRGFANQIQKDDFEKNQTVIYSTTWTLLNYSQIGLEQYQI